ncbi:MAG TPA: trypsin-like peptidase domain-containing protein [Symbiobacteriaceae bacterium]|nr:trypsin-like peptidase domain-containing protein [Symbiobacteriaceae bacterium]
MGGRLMGFVLAVLLLLTAVPQPAAAATVEERLNALEKRVVQLEKALQLSSLDVVSLVESAAPAVVSLYLVDGRDRVISQGTGFIVDADGVIVTNAHVVDGGYDIKVKFSDGKVVDAERALTDPFLDLAVLSIEGTGYPTLTFAETKPKVGEPVVVIGNAWGYSNSVTVGIVSGVDRPDPYHMQHYPSLQTDAAINHGNSGGPLLNREGEVVAMATWTELKDETDSIAFGIPTEQIAAAMKRFKAGRGIVRPWLGISAREPHWSRAGLPNTFGLLVTGSEAAGVAAKAGIRRGDWITKVNGAPVNYLMELRALLEKYNPGDTITITVERENAARTDWVESTIRVKLGEYSDAVKAVVPKEYDPDTDDIF